MRNTVIRRTHRVAKIVVAKVFFAAILITSLHAQIPTGIAPHSASQPSPKAYSNSSGSGLNLTYTVLDGEGTSANPGSLGPPAPVTTGPFIIHEQNVVNSVVQNSSNGYNSQPAGNSRNDYPLGALNPQGKFTDPIGINGSPQEIGTAFVTAVKAQHPNATFPEGTTLTVIITSSPHAYVAYNANHPNGTPFPLGDHSQTVVVVFTITNGQWQFTNAFLQQ